MGGAAQPAPHSQDSLVGRLGHLQGKCRQAACVPCAAVSCGCWLLLHWLCGLPLCTAGRWSCALSCCLCFTLQQREAQCAQGTNPSASPLPPAVQYKALAAAHGGDTSSPAYQQGLGELHQHMATKLLLAVQANGGIYIKARRGLPAVLCAACCAVCCLLPAGCCDTG